MMNHRGAISLSINMIVMIIISLAILTSGIILLQNLIGGAEEIKAELDQQTQQRLNDLLTEQGKQVALPFHTATVERGGKHVFGLGILNTGQVGDLFRLNVEFDLLIDSQGNSANTDFDPLEWIRYDREEMIIRTGENQKMALLVVIPKDAPSGQYFFKAQVFLENGETYGNVQRFFVTVK